MCCLSRSLSHTHTHILCAAARRHSSAGTVLSLLVLVGAAPGRRRHPGGGGGGSKLRALQHAADQSGVRGGVGSRSEKLCCGAAQTKKEKQKKTRREKNGLWKGRASDKERAAARTPTSEPRTAIKATVYHHRRTTLLFRVRWERELGGSTLGGRRRRACAKHKGKPLSRSLSLSLREREELT